MAVASRGSISRKQNRRLNGGRIDPVQRRRQGAVWMVACTQPTAFGCSRQPIFLELLARVARWMP
ncbi:hypothetical protein, partial [Xanthomonas hortorum]